ncbi:transposase family protein [Paraburkholderia xenovorans LB400]|jgi:transposase|nr:transposase [Paraburkholderia xenovorans]ABE32864.1 putative transposase [Paraburkholderia xenovorans LB400]AIP30568.1 transposase family protein [Paraburkholderia xenovorans LB400]AIP31783.1 transposase family protein [Paraburkholderia xenovorans LB400]AIP31824.1 transposase family protein [Paraburkholderia xenovorans LB400]
MTQDDLSFLPLRVTRVGVGGKRSFDPLGKRRLVEACEQPGASLSGLALKAGVNANQLRKWVRLHRQAQTRMSNDGMAASPSAFVPVVAIADTAPAPASMHSVRMQPEQRSSHLSSRSPASAWLSAQLPNGVKLELECSERDAALVSAMIAALGRR